ncbi:MAG: M2 family metallopeptidase [Bacteroidales bacterium]|nr:M2 family metallopeptidase [Bacteroidales bacterium]
MRGVVFSLIVLFLTACQSEKSTVNMNEEAKKVIDSYVEKLKPLLKKMNEAYWNASISGKDSDYQVALKYEMEYNKILSDTALFAKIKYYLNNTEVNDTLIKRQLLSIHNTMLPKQLDTALLNKISKIQNDIEKKFSTFRAVIDNKKYTDNDIEEILKTSTDNKLLEKAWVAVKEVGPIVAEDIKSLVKLRNQVAQKMGYKNYHQMMLALSEQDPEEIAQLFDKLDSLTSNAFHNLKSEMDKILAKRYGVKPEELCPWHYQNRFFQEAPNIYNFNVDKFYKDKNIEEITKQFFESIGLDINDILSRSDLYEKEGKNQHAYCIDIDNEGDIRILCNIKPNENWMSTMLHEFGHGVYDKYIDKNLPFVLREPAHTFTTEAIAMIFGRLTKNAEWNKEMLKLNENDYKMIKETGFKTLRLEQLVFSRWSQVMYRFEKSMYENPDQDLNKLWWDLVEKYQLIKRPKNRNMPDWATKIHIATSPCYYHNYLLGELLASQLNAYIVNNIIKGNDFKNPSYVNNKEIGKYLVEKVFKPGAKYHWNEMIEKATGEKLTPKYYAQQFLEN